ncbi:MAG TPA: pyridoxal phosphate-dependent aminotransferase family protein [Candidatus Paceibacterota bacterium]|nr:pyridoxal phosphate-dependent aminotransferase family protein [Verrucomicrobiota bacterium]HRZ43703.1 pyridoxal phosphate-dependent aminotransferase family protein [Candidatus Paceibacterota bacterium]
MSELMQGPPGPEILVGDRRLLYFGGTGYLGLQSHPSVLEAAMAGLRDYGMGSATSRRGFGSNQLLVEVEASAARFYGAEDALYFPTGYFGTAILLEGMSEPGVRLFVDEHAHFSVADAARGSGRPMHTFRHLDPDDLGRQLKGSLRAGEQAWVMTDGVFSVTGDVAPLAAYSSLLQAYPGSRMLVDDAHGLGVLGEQGRGTCEHLDVSGSGVQIAATLSKAMGGYGGIIPGCRDMVHNLRSHSRIYGGTNPLPAPVAAASKAGLEIARSTPALRASLRFNASRLREGLARMGLPVAAGPVPVAALRLGSAAQMQELHAALRADGILAPYLSGYCGAGPEGVLRIAVFATHTAAMVDRLLEALRGRV